MLINRGRNAPFYRKGDKKMALEAFLKQNKKELATVEYPASKAFLDENGNPLMWKIRPLKSKQAEKIRDEVNSFNKNGVATVDTALFNRKVAVACTVYPDLHNADLQDSYGVMGAENLIIEMLDNDGEYQMYVKKCLELSGYNETDEELAEQAKN